MSEKRLDVHTAGLPIVCQSCEARHGGICGSLNPEQLVELSKHTKKSVVSKSTAIVEDGENTEVFSNILSGVVKLTKSTADGREQVVGLQFAPDFLGRPFVEASSTRAEATTNVRLCSFPRSVIEDIISKTPEMEHLLYQQSLKELDEARDWMLTLGRKTASEKVASFFCLIADHVDPEKIEKGGEIRFDLSLTRSEMADFLGLTIETVSRQITKLRKQGLIEVEDRSTILVPNLQRLRDASEADLSK